MPSNIRGLTHLTTLSIFIVGSKAGFGLIELNNLQLGGKIHIKGLENVSNERDAREANLIGKEKLSELYLSWAIDANSQVSGIGAEQVLEGLEPHKGLKCFGMNGYMGINIPNWMRNTSILEGLVKVILYNCRNCERVPALGKLPCLTSLYVFRMRELKYIDDDLYEGANKKAFPSLKKMQLEDLPNLERVLKAEGVEMLPQLSNLRLDRNHKLAFSFLPSVETMNMLTSLRQLSITGGYENATLPNGLEGIISSLQYLSLSDFPSLHTLQIRGCPKLSSLPDCFQGLINLRVLYIYDCPELTSLPASFQGLINLQVLTIYGYPMVEKRCKKETGEDWHKIAHVPNLKLDSTVEPETSFYGNLMNSFHFLLYLVLS
jgi:hypothetical protein